MLLFAKKRRSGEMNILEVFWTNVQWHVENKGVKLVALMGGNAKSARDKTANVTLKKVQEIAGILDIDDYAILFEDIA